MTDVDVLAFSPKQNRTSGLLALESRRMLLVRNEGDVQYDALLAEAERLGI